MKLIGGLGFGFCGLPVRGGERLHSREPSERASLDPFKSGFWVFLGSDMKGSSEIDRGLRVWFFCGQQKGKKEAEGAARDA